MTELKQYSPGAFWNKVMSAVAMAIVVSVTPSAIIGPVFQALADYGAFWASLNMITNLAMYAVPVLCGALAAGQFGFNMIEKTSVALATLIGSGAVAYSAKDQTYTLIGMGDLINTILVTALAIVVIFAVRQYVGSWSIIWDPIIGACVVGGIGTWTYPYVHLISTTVGTFLNQVTKLEPLLMCTILGLAFAVIIATPLLTVGLAYAFSIAGIAGGAASVGITACFFTVAYAVSKVNGKGLVVAMAFGSVKMMLANFLRHPQMLIPIALSGALAGLVDSLPFARMENGAAYAGFGFPVAPINAYTHLHGSVGANLLTVGLMYLVLPTVVALLSYHFCKNVLHIVDENHWYVDLNA